ncbi:MAG: 3'-5' exonuclease [Hyphomicrobiales bacterium]|nr:3'-5' exonuclease [Hyphomicrobiales bacterium]MCC2106752.1 3'-5' exonuclease [Hyphomicrobiales bacterium]
MTALDQRYVVLDLEGDGNQPPSAVEIALVECSPDGNARRHRWLVDPEKPITGFATRIHGLTDRDVAGAPRLADIEDDLRALIDGAVIIGHNVKVDIDVLRRAIPDLCPQRVLDTLKLAKLVVPGQPSYGLHKLALSLNLKPPEESEGRDAHSALFDALLTTELFRFLVDAAGDKVERRLNDSALDEDEHAQPRLF